MDEDCYSATGKVKGKSKSTLTHDHPSFTSQGYLNIPEPPYWETVEKVGAELENDDNDIHEQLQNTNPPKRQLGPGETTLDEFIEWLENSTREPYNYDYMLPPPLQQQLLGNGNGGMVSPASQGLSNGMCKNKVNGGKSERGHKMMDRRPKIMLENWDSAAQSRERKQACTSELEDELMFLRGENKLLKQSLVELQSEQTNCRCNMIRKIEAAIAKCEPGNPCPKKSKRN